MNVLTFAHGTSNFGMIFVHIGCSRYVMMSSPHNLTVNTIMADLVSFFVSFQLENNKSVVFYLLANQHLKCGMLLS